MNDKPTTACADTYAAEDFDPCPHDCGTHLPPANRAERRGNPTHPRKGGGRFTDAAVPAPARRKRR